MLAWERRCLLSLLLLCMSGAVSAGQYTLLAWLGYGIGVPTRISRSVLTSTATSSQFKCLLRMDNSMPPVQLTQTTIRSREREGHLLPTSSMQPHIPPHRDLFMIMSQYLALDRPSTAALYVSGSARMQSCRRRRQCGRTLVSHSCTVWVYMHDVQLQLFVAYYSLLARLRASIYNRHVR